MNYKHDDWVAGHGDVLKHVVFTAVIRELQATHPEGLSIVDCMAGDGVYDLNQHSNPAAYQNGVLKVLERLETDAAAETPKVVQEYCQLLCQATGCSGASDLDVYPGSPVFAKHLLRPQDEHTLLDAYVELVQWTDDKRSTFYQQDCYETNNQAMSLILPYAENSGKHPLILLDPDYWNDNEYGQVQQLMATILDQNPHATILVWLPLLHNHPLRWNFSTSLKELAKKAAQTGRYYASLQIAPQKYQGSAVLVANPPRNLDDVVSDETLHWLANAMNQGKDEFTVEQVMKKKKK